MKEIPKLSVDNEERLLNAMDEIVELTSDGMKPNDAICKVATDNSFPAGFVKLLVNGYNISMFNTQRQQSKDVFEKLAEYETADPDVILEKMFPKDYVAEKKANQVATLFSSDYETNSWTKNVNDKYLAKFKEVDITLIKAAQDNKPTKPFSIIDYKQKTEQIVGDVRRQISKLRDNCNEKIAQLESYFRSPQHIPFYEVLDNSIELFGKEAEALFTIIADRYNKVEKKAEYEVKPTAVDLNKKPYSLVNTIIKEAKEYNYICKRFAEAYIEAEQVLKPETKNAKVSNKRSVI